MKKLFLFIKISILFFIPFSFAMQNSKNIQTCGLDNYRMYELYDKQIEIQRAAIEAEKERQFNLEVKRMGKIECDTSFLSPNYIEEGQTNYSSGGDCSEDTSEESNEELDITEDEAVLSTSSNFSDSDYVDSDDYDDEEICFEDSVDYQGKSYDDRAINTLDNNIKASNQNNSKGFYKYLLGGVIALVILKVLSQSDNE